MDPLSSNAKLGAIGHKHQLSGFANQNPLYQNTWSTQKSATTVEAMIGAVYREAGVEAAREAIQNIGVATLIASSSR